MMAPLAATGPNQAKAKFFKDCASAFEFLALFNQLPAERQKELMELVMSYYAEVYKNEKPAG